MRVFVAGATGTLGRPTVAALVAAGHAVRGVARTAEKAEALRRLGAEPVAVDLFDAGAVRAALAGSEAVLHLATRIPPLARMRRRSAWRDNDRLRNQGASVLVNAALAVGAELYLQESITFLYRDRGDEWLHETAPLDAPWPLASARDAEAEAGRFGAHGGRGVVLRFAMFYAPYAPSTLDTVRLARWRLVPVFGAGAHFTSAIHVDDAAAAVAAALAVPAGIYNVGDDEPLPMADHLDAMARAFGFGRPPRLPLGLARMLLGPSAMVMTRSQRVANTMFKAVSEWRPRYPSARDGWQAIAAALGASRK
jgi:nucleoside-diphosphate-sugar epimerase